jgi:hypothetical protein
MSWPCILQISQSDYYFLCWLLTGYSDLKHFLNDDLSPVSETFLHGPLLWDLWRTARTRDVTTTLRGHSDPYGRLRDARIAIALPQQIYKQPSATIWMMDHGIFLVRPDNPWGPPNLLYKVHRVSPGGKAAGCGVHHTPPSIAEVKGRVLLHLFSISGLSCPVIGWPLHFTFTFKEHIK